MMNGQTVYYRLTEENYGDIIRQRELVVSVQVFDGMSQTRFFHGAPVSIGQVLAAEVVNAYSKYDYARLIHPYAKKTSMDPNDKKYFSGYADIRVKLPGNDTLWVPLAQLDENPKPKGEIGSFGVGLLVVPEIGKFTVVLPPPLI